MTLTQLWCILRVRLRVIVAIAFLVVLAALAVSLALPKTYTASTAVVIDVKSPDPVAGMVLPGMISPAYMATQVDIISSDRVAQRAVSLLHLDEDPLFRQQWETSRNGRGEFTAWLADLLQKKLVVYPSRESNVISISFRDADPAFAARAANAFAQSFIDVSLELKVEPARLSASWFEGQTQLARDRLEAAKQVYSSYQQTTGVVATNERIDLETTRLSELSTQLTALQGEVSSHHSTSLASGDLSTLPEVIQNPMINSLKTDIAQLEAKLQDSSVGLGRNHPQIQRAESELASLRARLASETGKVVGSIKTAYRVSKQKEKELLAAIAQQKTRLLGLSKQRDEISVLKLDVDSTQRSFDDISLRAAQARLESMSVLTNVVVLNPASEPSIHSSPKTRVNLMVAAVLGSLLGIGFALLQELRHRRAHSIGDVVEALNLPVLAAIPHVSLPAPGRRRVRRPLFARLRAQPGAILAGESKA